MKTYKIITILCIFLLLIITKIPNAISDENKKIIYVDDDGGKDYTNIKDAIENAMSGDTIYVYNGTYVENIEINKSISLIGEDKNTTIIDGYKSGTSVVFFENSSCNVSFSGFTIQNCIIGIYLMGYNNRIANNIIQNNKYYYERLEPNSDYIAGVDLYPILYPFGGIYISGHDNEIFNNYIVNNSESGITLITDSYSNFISDNTIINNTAGIFLVYSNNNTISGNTITNNGVDINIWLDSSGNVIFHNNIMNNNHSIKDSGNNTWYNITLKQGNYWNDYQGTDKNNDGIGDIPYNVPGEKSQDIYPLMSPYYGGVVVDKFYVNEGSVFYMILIAMILTIVFLVPIAYILYKKNRPRQ